jgi:hypothetical protein
MTICSLVSSAQPSVTGYGYANMALEESDDDDDVIMLTLDPLEP